MRGRSRPWRPGRKEAVHRGLCKFHDREEEVPPVVNASIRFAVVLSCELFEVVDKVLEELTTCDLMVLGLSLVQFSSW